MIKLKEGSQKSNKNYEEVAHFKIKVKEVEKRENIQTIHRKEVSKYLNKLEEELCQRERRLEE
jgi:hypothetical protein